jgi:hypothetical protein
MSTRSGAPARLRRQLSPSGTSCRKLVDNLRESRTRTFKRWAGLSPQEYRKNSPVVKTAPRMAGNEGRAARGVL